jgi:tetratricopeptide (TPR) repeat protein
VWVNYEMADTLIDLHPSAREEAVRYYSIARALRPETAHQLAHLLERMLRNNEALAVFADLVARRPHDAQNLTCYGHCLKANDNKNAPKILAQAVDEGRRAVQLEPDDALAHRNLGFALRTLGRYEEATSEFRESLRLVPDDPTSLYWLGSTLSGQKKRDESIAVLREALRLKSDFADAHACIAEVLVQLRKLDEAIAEYREAIRLKPDIGRYHVFLGFALHAQKKDEEAIAEIRLGQKVDPEYPEAHCSLGYVLYELGDYATAAAEMRRGEEMDCRRKGNPFVPSPRLKNAERIAELATHLPAIVKGTEGPNNARDAVFFADMAYKRKFFWASSRLWTDALSAQPALAESRQTQHLYNAACAAALAAAGQGADNPLPDGAARAKLRRQAIAWLKTELDTWAKVVDSGKAENTNMTSHFLRHWQRDPDLASIRGAESLANLPEAERTDLRALWSAVDSLLAKTECRGGK